MDEFPPRGLKEVHMLGGFVTAGEELGSIFRQNRVQVARVADREDWAKRSGVSLDAVKDLENGNICSDNFDDVVRAILPLPVSKGVKMNMLRLVVVACTGHPVQIAKANVTNTSRFDSERFLQEVSVARPSRLPYRERL